MKNMNTRTPVSYTHLDVYKRQGETCIGTLKKELTFFKPKYNIDFNGWHVEGDVFAVSYTHLAYVRCHAAHCTAASAAPPLRRTTRSSR